MESKNYLIFKTVATGLGVLSVCSDLGLGGHCIISFIRSWLKRLLRFARNDKSGFRVKPGMTGSDWRSLLKVRRWVYSSARFLDFARNDRYYLDFSGPHGVKPIVPYAVLYVRWL